MFVLCTSVKDGDLSQAAPTPLIKTICFNSQYLSGVCFYHPGFSQPFFFFFFFLLTFLLFLE